MITTTWRITWRSPAAVAVAGDASVALSGGAAGVVLTALGAVVGTAPVRALFAPPVSAAVSGVAVEVGTETERGGELQAAASSAALRPKRVTRRAPRPR